jgi:hypothetical protein
MPNREKYIQLSIDEFINELKENADIFSNNMKNLKIGNMSFPEWFETLGAWAEVGTDFEKESFTSEETQN